MAAVRHARLQPAALRWRAGAQHPQTLYSLLAHIPGLKVVVPSTAYKAKGLMISAVRDGSPVVVMEHKFLGAAAKGNVPEDSYTVPIGQAEIIRAGHDITLCAIGRMTHLCLEVARELAADGISAEVIDVLTLSPLDEGTILDSVKRTHRVDRSRHVVGGSPSQTWQPQDRRLVLVVSPLFGLEPFPKLQALPELRSQNTRN